MSIQKPVVLVVERDEALEKLNTLALEAAGYHAVTPSPGMDILTFVEQTRPRVIILGVHSATPEDRNVLTQLQANPNTRDIPVVVVAPDQYLRAIAKAVPITSATVAHPYKVDELENAVAHAVHNPPPTAVLPPAATPSSTVVHFVTEELARNAHHLVIETIRNLRGEEPYRTRFAHVLPDLVDDLGRILGAINEGLRHSLPPTDVLAVPSIQRSIEEHVALRKREGIDAASTIQEYQILALQVSHFLAALVEQGQVSVHDFFQLRQQAQQYVDELVRLVVRYYTSNNQSNHGPTVQG